MDTIALSAGTPLALPPGTGSWRVTLGRIEAYLVAPERRRLIALLEPGHAVPSLPEGRLSLILVALDDCMLEANKDDAPGWVDGIRASTGFDPQPMPTDATALAVALDRHFAAQDMARDADFRARAEVGAGKPEADPSGMLAALAQAAGWFGRDPADRRLAGRTAQFEDAPALARMFGLRATRIILAPDRWRDDGGPLLLRRRDDRSAVAAFWKRRAYRDADGQAIMPEDHAALGWRLYGPLADDVSSFRGVGRSVLRSLGGEAALIVGAGLGIALMGILVPVASGWIFDDIVPAGAGGLLIAAGLALFVAAMFSATFSAVRGLAVARVTGRGQVDMAAAVTDHVLRLPARFFKTLSAGDFNQRLDALERLRELVTDVLLNAALTLLFAIIYLVLLFGYDQPMALAGLLLTLVYAGAVAVSRLAQRGPLRDAAVLEGKLAGLTFETLEGIAKLRSAAAEERMLARWNTLYRKEQGARAAGQRIGTHFSAFADGWHVVTLLGLFATAALLARGGIGPGRLIGFLTAFAIFQQSFIGLCDALMRLQTARPLAERARPILTAEPETGIGRADPGRLTGDIQASGLTFGYDGAMAPLINGLTFSVKPGEHLAIVGGSGSGKSTILRLLLGFEKPLTGSLAYDGQELSGLDPTRVRAQIGVVLQSSQLFAGSINENIRGASDATLDQCRLAAERAGLGSDLAGFPMGLHTPITEGAGTLSGGQRQRILIARALASEPAILFFDEATSALDNATQAIVAQTLDALKATRITIAHRLSTVRNADRICVLEKGAFVEQGAFAELMSRNGVFAMLAKRQLLED